MRDKCGGFEALRASVLSQQIPTKKIFFEFRFRPRAVTGLEIDFGRHEPGDELQRWDHSHLSAAAPSAKCLSQPRKNASLVEHKGRFYRATPRKRGSGLHAANTSPIRATRDSPADRTCISWCCATPACSENPPTLPTVSANRLSDSQSGKVCKVNTLRPCWGPKASFHFRDT